MYNRIEDQETPTPETNMDESLDPTTGVKVYERPTRQPIPIWAAILLLLILVALSWYAYQALQ